MAGHGLADPTAGDGGGQRAAGHSVPGGAGGRVGEDSPGVASYLATPEAAGAARPVSHNPSL